MSDLPSSTEGREHLWWLATGDKPEGPFKEASVLERLRAGQLSAAALACPVGGQEWRPLAEWAEFMAGKATLWQVTPAAFQPTPDQSACAESAPFHGVQLPWMARAICHYCIFIYPAFVVFGLLATVFTGGSASELPSESPIVFYAVVYDVFTWLVDAGLAVATAIGGLQVRRLKKVGVTVVKVTFIISFAWAAIEVLSTVFWGVVVSMNGQPEVTDAVMGWGDVSFALFVLLFTGLVAAAFVFQIVAFIWLIRHQRELPLKD